MAVIITMAGAGSRFINRGYHLPKYLIKVKNRTLFEWSMLSLSKFFDQDFYFAIRDEQFIPELRLIANSIGISKINFAIRNNLSSGQAETAFDVVNMIDKNEKIWIYNIDTYVKKGLDPESLYTYDGCIYVFNSSANNMSFVKYDDNGLVVDLAEKVVISEWATVGLYGFKSAEFYIELYNRTYIDSYLDFSNSEKYIVPMYKNVLDESKRIVAPRLNNSDVFILGTPDDVVLFEQSSL